MRSFAAFDPLSHDLALGNFFPPGEQVARFYGPFPMKVLSFGAKKEFVDWTSVEHQYRSNRLTPQEITKDILSFL